ncbi:stage II sporulation protein M [Lentilactobacillus sp. SPB1-3]|uniref:Stage II sporulation protein M n=1 Tax=Lentilactobacillus terminaliae TaxID=3003483 RepID=A0ACD5DEI8_9LACO|nr:stage II sporulation protein M [Lentilactobacillus sp. SPB1-3]MCZ0977466.1 stage II sporulation protein M [Lentilactobacillus sp. SPB1-3]
MIRESLGRFNTDYRKRFWQFLLIMVVIWIVVYAGIELTSSTEAAKHLLTSSLSGDSSGASSHNFLPLFFHNFGSSLTIIVLGLIPIPLYYLFLLFNASSVGAVLTIGPQPILLFLFGILPHGIFEIPGQIISAAISARLAWYMIDRFIRHRQRSETFGEMVKTTAIDTLVYVLPLLFIAAIIEQNITPILIHNFIIK